MDKVLLLSKEQLYAFEKAHTGYDSFHGNVVSDLDGPTEYPCLLLWEIVCDDNGPDYLTGDYVYKSDFEEK